MAFGQLPAIDRSPDFTDTACCAHAAPAVVTMELRPVELRWAAARTRSPFSYLS